MEFGTIFVERVYSITENLGMSPNFSKINSKFSSSFGLENQTQF
jgi:hypothetical protein